jgi:anti-sigma B factor antagonist
MVMEINTSEMKRVQLFEVIGRVDSSNATELGNAMDRAVDDGRSNLVLDLGGVEYMSSAGLREMVRVLKRVKRSGGDLRIANWPGWIRSSKFIRPRLKPLAVFNTPDRCYPSLIEEPLWAK